LWEFIKWLLSGALNVLTIPGKITTKLGGGAKTAAAANAIAPAAAIGSFQEYKGRKSFEDINNAIAASAPNLDYDLVEY
jgi:hypothetical protein